MVRIFLSDGKEFVDDEANLWRETKEAGTTFVHCSKKHMRTVE
jgi:hypothetical protein